MQAANPRLRSLQRQVLDSVEACFKACHELQSPSIAFTATTARVSGDTDQPSPTLAVEYNSAPQPATLTRLFAWVSTR